MFGEVGEGRTNSEKDIWVTHLRHMRLSDEAVDFSAMDLSFLSAEPSALRERGFS